MIEAYVDGRPISRSSSSRTSVASVYLAGGFIGGFFRELPFVANSTVKVAVLGIVSLYAAGDLRRRLGLVVLVIVAFYKDWVLASIAFFVFPASVLPVMSSCGVYTRPSTPYKVGVR